MGGKSDEKEQQNGFPNIEKPAQEEQSRNVFSNIGGFILDIVLCRGDISEITSERKPVKFRQLFRFATWKDKAYVIIGCFLALIGGVLQPLVMIFDGLIASRFLVPDDKHLNDGFVEDVFPYFVYLIASGTLVFIMSYMQNKLLRKASSNMIKTLKEEYVKSVLRQDAAWFDRKTSGVLTSQLNDNIGKIQDGIGDKLGLLLKGFTQYFFSIVFCLFFEWRITLIIIMTGPIYTITQSLAGKFLSSTQNKMMTTSNDAAGIFEECVLNVKTVAACNGQEHMVEKYRKVLQEGLKSAKTYYTWYGCFQGVGAFQQFSMIGMALWFGVSWYWMGIFTQAGLVMMIVDTISNGGYYLGILGPHMMAVLRSQVAAAIVYEIIDQETILGEEKENKNVTLEKRIEFRNVEFCYASRDVPILQGINWHVSKGESIAFVGHSGCGKSTSISLLTKLYKPTSGTITIDGVSIDDIDTVALRKIIGIVEQEPQLFNGTIVENILMGRPGLTEKNAIEAAKLANAHHFITELSEGYNTLLGSTGVSLSGGQKQRIAIARAIVTNPQILLLDEATSALDTQSEKIVQKALDKAADGRTTIIIAHRLSTLKHVDRICVVNKGKVVEEGTHSELLVKEDGIYAGLARAQEIEYGGISESPSITDELEDSTEVDKLLKRAFSKISLVKQEEETKKKKKKRSLWEGIRLIYSNLNGYEWHWKFLILTTIASGVQLSFFVINDYIAFITLENEEGHQMYGKLLLIVPIGVGFFNWITTTLMFYLGGWMGEGVSLNIRTRVLRSLLHRPLSSLDERSPANCVASVSQNAPNFTAAVDYNAANNMTYLMSMMFSIGVSFYFNWKMGIVSTVLSIFLALVVFSIVHFQQTAQDEKNDYDKTGEIAVEIVERARTIQLLTVEQHFTEEFTKQLESAKKYTKTLDSLESLNQGILNCFIFFNVICCYAFGTYLAYNGEKNLSGLYLAGLCGQMAGWCIMYAAAFFPDVVRASSAACNLRDLIDTDEHINFERNKGFIKPINGEVEIRNVNFAYPSRPDVYVARDLNLKVEKGKSIALVGPSGCGKSTTINLLEAFYEANSGQVKIDKDNVNDVNILHLRRNLALVHQEPVLFSGTIKDNVSLGVDNVTMGDIIQACATANAKNFIEDFPLGYETEVGEGGKSLSGGQKQRIAIARALIRNPKILLLDEATSALDTESEKIVQKALNDASYGRTTITIAHRLSSIQNSDRIFYIEKGTVVESGTHEELINMNRKYAKLVMAQQLSD